MKIWWLLLILLLIPLASAMEECQRVTSAADIPCRIISTWNGTTACSSYELIFYNSTPSNITKTNWSDYSPTCQATFNITTLGTYQYRSSLENGVITVNADLTFGGTVVFVFFIINIIIFIIPYFVRFLEDEVWNKFIGKAIWALGLMFLALNTTLIIDLAQSAALSGMNILWTYHWFFVKGIYIAVLVLMIQAALAAIKEWNINSKARRMNGQ